MHEAPTTHDHESRDAATQMTVCHHFVKGLSETLSFALQTLPLNPAVSLTYAMHYISKGGIGYSSLLLFGAEKSVACVADAGSDI